MFKSLAARLFGSDIITVQAPADDTREILMARALFA